MRIKEKINLDMEGLIQNGPITIVAFGDSVTHDCYKKWKKLSETQDITYLLANRINHPTKEMHELFAQSLFEMIFDDIDAMEKTENSTMYENA